MNTVHDSVVLDVHKDVVDEVKELIKEEASRMQQYVKQEFGYMMRMNLAIEVSSGPNWAEQS